MPYAQGEPVPAGSPVSLCYLVAFAVLVAAYLHEGLLPEYIFCERDLPLFFYPALELWTSSLKQGTLALWNPYIMCGEPLLANLQPGMCYPPNLLFVLLPIDTAFCVSIALHLFLCGVFVYLLLRDLGGSSEACAIAAVCFCFSGCMLSLHNVLSSFWSITWLPLAVLLLRRTLARRSRRWFAATCAVLACQFAGGGVEICMMTWVLLSALTLWPGLLPGSGGDLRIGHRMAVLAGCGLVTALLGAVQLLPFLELVRHSARAGGLAYAQAAAWSMHPADFVNLLAPDLLWRGPAFYRVDQNWLKTIYTGLIPLSLAAWGLAALRRTGGLLLILIVSAVLCLGANTPLYEWLYTWLPPVGWMRYPAKFFCVTLLVLCVLAGLGWDRIRRPTRSRRVLARLLCGLLCGACTAVLLCVLSGRLDLTVPAGASLRPDLIRLNILRVCLFGALASLVLLVQLNLPRRNLFYLLLPVLLMDVYWGTLGNYAVCSRALLHARPPHLAIISRDTGGRRFYVQPDIRTRLNPRSGIRLDRITARKELLESNISMPQRCFDLSGFSVLPLAHTRALLQHIAAAPPGSTRLLDMLGVGYLLWADPLDRPGYQLLASHAGYLYRNTRAFPRAWLVSDYALIRDRQDGVARLTSPAFDPRGTVLLETVPQPAASRLRTPYVGPERVTIAAHGTDALELATRCTEDRFVVLRDAWYPGWQAFVDGTPVPLYRANIAFRAVRVPAGCHTLQLRFQPRSVRIGMLLSGAGILIILILLRRRRRQQ